jgi:uncharacterized protein (TIGR02246 family)
MWEVSAFRYVDPMVNVLSSSFELCFGLSQSGMNTDEQAIRELIAKWHRATAAGEVDTILDCMTDDVVFLVAGRPPMAGRATFESGLRELLKTHRLASSGDVTEVVVSGDLAYSLTRLTVRMEPLAGGEPIVRSGHTMSILRKFPDGRWRMTRDANLMPPPGEDNHR